MWHFTPWVSGHVNRLTVHNSEIFEKGYTIVVGIPQHNATKLTVFLINSFDGLVKNVSFFIQIVYDTYYPFYSVNYG